MKYERRASIPNGPAPQAGFGARGRPHGIWGASPGLLYAGGEQGAGCPYPNLRKRVRLMLAVLRKSE